jgi:hypothetical protein
MSRLFATAGPIGLLFSSAVTARPMIYLKLDAPVR